MNLREWLIAVGTGVVVMGFIVFAVSKTGTQMSRHTLTGVITQKNFEPQPETQITIGRGGLRQKDVAGTYTFEVKVSSGRTYTVWIDQTTYEAKKIGDRFQFPRPREESP